MTTGPRRLGPALLLALLAATLVVGALVYRARTPDLALEVPRIERDLRLGAPGDAGVAQLRFFSRFDEPEATVLIVGRQRRVVRTLAEGPLARNRELVCQWDGSNDTGELVAPGHYRLRVVLPGQDRDMLYPRRIVALPPSEPPADATPAEDEVQVPSGECAPGSQVAG